MSGKGYVDPHHALTGIPIIASTYPAPGHPIVYSGDAGHPIHIYAHPDDIAALHASLADPRDQWRHKPEQVRLARALATLRRDLLIRPLTPILRLLEKLPR